jgi:hypothetical protein
MIGVAYHDGGTVSFAARLVNYATIPKQSKKIVSGLEAHALAGLNLVVFKIQDALLGAQRGLYFLGVERLGQMIVGARFQALNDILLGLFRG